MENKFDVIIVGGSYAGMSAAMALGRSLRNVLLIDSGEPCNLQTPHSHNFMTQDGKEPGAIATEAKKEILAYPSVTYQNGLAIAARKTKDGFQIDTASGKIFGAKKLLFATGVKDLFPAIGGFGPCWGISVLHCPYCHGYELKGQAIGLLGNGEAGFELCKLLHNWSTDLTLFTNGKSLLTVEQTTKLETFGMPVMENIIAFFEHTSGRIEKVVFEDESIKKVSALFARINFQQHCDLPQKLGCGFNEQGYIKTDEFKRTSVHGIYAAGDNTTMFRAVSVAIAAGTVAGAAINKEIIDESF